jgi:hypothetical protein
MPLQRPRPTLTGANSGSDCSGTALGADAHTIAFVVPAGAYTEVSVVDTRQGGAVSQPAFQRQTGGTLFAKAPKKH